MRDERVGARCRRHDARRAVDSIAAEQLGEPEGVLDRHARGVVVEVDERRRRGGDEPRPRRQLVVRVVVGVPAGQPVEADVRPPPRDDAVVVRRSVRSPRRSSPRARRAGSPTSSVRQLAWRNSNAGCGRAGRASRNRLSRSTSAGKFGGSCHSTAVSLSPSGSTEAKNRRSPSATSSSRRMWVRYRLPLTTNRNARRDRLGPLGDRRRRRQPVERGVHLDGREQRRVVPQPLAPAERPPGRRCPATTGTPSRWSPRGGGRRARPAATPSAQPTMP